MAPKPNTHLEFARKPETTPWVVEILARGPAHRSQNVKVMLHLPAKPLRGELEELKREVGGMYRRLYQEWCEGFAVKAWPR